MGKWPLALYTTHLKDKNKGWTVNLSSQVDFQLNQISWNFSSKITSIRVCTDLIKTLDSVQILSDLKIEYLLQIVIYNWSFYKYKNFFIHYKMSFQYFYCKIITFCLFITKYQFSIFRLLKYKLEMQKQFCHVPF